jgi:hypothetical protein
VQSYNVIPHINRAKNGTAFGERSLWSSLIFIFLFFLRVFQQRNYNKENHRVGQLIKEFWINIINVIKQKLKGNELNKWCGLIYSWHEDQEKLSARQGALQMEQPRGARRVANFERSDNQICSSIKK